MEPVLEHVKEEWSLCISLTGGHPSLLLDAVQWRRELPAFNTATAYSVIVNLCENNRVPDLSDAVTAQMAQTFLLDVLSESPVHESKHSKILEKGWAWYASEESSSSKGRVQRLFRT